MRYIILIVVDDIERRMREKKNMQSAWIFILIYGKNPSNFAKTEVAIKEIDSVIASKKNELECWITFSEHFIKIRLKGDGLLICPTMYSEPLIVYCRFFSHVFF